MSPHEDFILFHGSVILIYVDLPHNITKTLIDELGNTSGQFNSLF